MDNNLPIGPCFPFLDIIVILGGGAILWLAIVLGLGLILS